jgi:hypothetical protein
MICGAKNTATSPSTLPIMPALPSSCPTRTADDVRDQELESARDESQRGQGGRDLLTGVGELPDQVDNWSDIHCFRPLIDSSC